MTAYLNLQGILSFDGLNLSETNSLHVEMQIVLHKTFKVLPLAFSGQNQQMTNGPCFFLSYFFLFEKNSCTFYQIVFSWKQHDISVRLFDWNSVPVFKKTRESLCSKIWSTDFEIQQVK